MSAAQVNKKQPNDHERATEVSKRRVRNRKDPFQPFFDMLRGSKIRKAFYKADQAQNGEDIRIHKSILVRFFFSAQRESPNMFLLLIRTKNTAEYNA
jgi:hypothetical protein